MISTVTTTVTTIAMLSMGATLGALASAVLILMLALKEVASADSRRSLQFLARSLSVGIAPLLLAFALIVLFKALEVIS
jgi:hypothetical protein